MAKRRMPDGHGRPCPYCGLTMLGYKRPYSKPLHPRYPTRDHIRPRKDGGGPVLICCSECNNKKGDMPPELWLARIAKHRPGQALAASIAMGIPMPQTSGAQP